MYAWTQERVDRALKMWNAGSTSAEIAQVLRVSRSAVMGKIKRLQDSGAADERRAKSAPLRKPGPARVRTRRFAAPPPPPIPLPEPAPEPVAPLRLPLVALSNLQCHAIVGDASPALYCAHPVRPGSDYCPAHHRLYRIGVPKNEKRKSR